MSERTYMARVEVLVVAKSKAHAAEIIDSFLGDETVMDHRIVNGPESYRSDHLVSWRRQDFENADFAPTDKENSPFLCHKDHEHGPECAWKPRIARHCKNWADRRCERCGVQSQYFEVSSDFACPYYEERA